jgi:tetratricopeptide (TPR) repeat protein
MTVDNRTPEFQPNSPPLPSAKRARLERLFAAGQQKATGLNPNYDYAAELFGQCVLGDPGNDVYVKTFIENLQKKYANNRSGATLSKLKELGAKNAVKKALESQNWAELYKNAIKVLMVNPWDINTLTALAQASKKLGHLECEMFYLKTALTTNSKDPTVNRLCAIAAAERQLLDQAIYCWHRVEEAYPNDEEAKRAISILQTVRMEKGGFSVATPEKEADRKAAVYAKSVDAELTAEKKLLDQIAKDPKQLKLYEELAQYYINEDQFDKAEDILSRAFDVSDGDADVLDKWEDIQLMHYRYSILHAKDIGKKKALQAEYYKKELEYYKRKCERFPGDLFFRYELGIRYMLNKQFNDAIRELQSSRNDPRRKGVCFLALGQCFQSIHQYRLALDHYEKAISELSEREIDNKKEAFRLAGRLALSLADLDRAEKHLSSLAALDFTYKETSALLDKLAEMRKNQNVKEKQPKPTPPPTVEDSSGRG